MNKRTHKHESRRIRFYIVLPVLLICVLMLSWCGVQRNGDNALQTPESTADGGQQNDYDRASGDGQAGVGAGEEKGNSADIGPGNDPDASIAPETVTDPDLDTDPDSEPEPEPPPTMPWEVFSPYCLPETDPFGEAFDYKYAVQAGGAIVEDFLNPEPIFFGLPEDYTTLPGVTTFRGNNFRNAPSFGTAEISAGNLTEKYLIGIGSLDHWTGVGWSGQPVIVQWDYALQQHMNMLPEKKEKEGLVEVIQGAVDGYVYFFDLADGKPTRNAFRYGEPIKGGVSIDPRGYPILFIGQGDQFGGRTGFGMFSLIDFKELYFLPNHDPFALKYHDLFDSNPLFDIPNDRLIECGENGVIYNIKLNTDFDLDAGTISLSPELTRYRYTTKVNSLRSLGTEGSPSAFMNYIFTADNGGLVQCVDLMTFSPVWVRDCTDDTDVAIVLDWEEETETMALYTGCQTDYQKYSYIRKLNAENGDLLWEYSYQCYTDTAVSGGLLATPVVGRGDISDLIVFWVGKVIGMGGGGALVAFDKVSGDVVWEKILPNYGWSSPVGIYTDDGRCYIVVCDSMGKMYLVRGTTGEVLDSISLGANIEASPAVYGSTIIVGTRGMRIYGVKVS